MNRSREEDVEAPHRYGNIDDIDVNDSNQQRSFEVIEDDHNLSIDPVMPPAEDGEKGGRFSKMKGVFGKKKKKDKKEKEKDEEQSEDEEQKDKPASGKRFKMPSFKRGSKKDKPKDEAIDMEPPPEQMPPEEYAPGSPDEMTSFSFGSPGAFSGSADPMQPSRGPTPSDHFRHAPALSRKERLRQSFTSMIKQQPRAPLVSGEDVAELKPLPMTPMVRSSTVLNLLLLAGVAMGILMWAFGSQDVTLSVVGPTIFGLSLFALVAKIFLTGLFEENPFPLIRPLLDKYEKKFAQEPLPEAQPAWQMQAVGRVNHSYSRSQEAVDTSRNSGHYYDPSIDMTLRSPDGDR